MRTIHLPNKRRVSMLLMMALMVTTTIRAAQRSMDEMRSIAYTAFNLSETQGDPFAVPLLGVRCKSSDLLDASLFENGEEAFYVFSFTNNAPGYVIVSADTRLPEIIAYSASDAFRSDRLPEAMIAYLQRFVEKMNVTPKSYVAKRRARGKLFANSLFPSVEPLLGDIAFNQKTPYNNACPLIDGTRAVTGCVPTAMSQIMKYYEYPNKMKGDAISYITDTYKIPITWNCASTTFDWTKVKAIYKASVPPYTANETVEKDIEEMTLSGIEFNTSSYIGLQIFVNVSDEPLSFKVQFILADKKGNFIRPVPQESQVSSLPHYSYYNPYWIKSPVLPSNIKDGIYRLYIGIQPEGTSRWSYAKKWDLTNPREEFYLTVDKEGNFFTISGSDYQYPCGYSDDEAAEVAKLHAASGAAVEADYGLGSSSAIYAYAGKALVNNFSYDRDMEKVYPSYFSESVLHERIQSELTSGRPVYIGGISKENYGHAFIIDGFRYDGSTPYYHVNWGWGGFCNAYFLIDDLRPSAADAEGQDIDYSYSYSFFCAIQPENNIDEGKSFGCFSYTVDKTVYSVKDKMILTIPRTAKLENLSFLPFTGVIKAYVYTDNNYYELGEVISLRDLESSHYLLNDIIKNFSIPSTIPTGTYRIVLKSKETGSYVEKIVYSAENPVVKINGKNLMGDVNGDGKLSIADVTAMLELLNKGKYDSAADMNGDRIITKADVTALVNIIIKGN